MVVMAPDQLNTLKTTLQANLDDFGIGPMPQNGGNSALTGGNIFVFNPRSSQAVIKAAFDYVIYTNFDLNVMENNLAQQSAAGQVVGAPTNILFTGDFQKKINELTTRYANIPVQNYTPFTSSTVALRAEPRNQTQKMYGALDPVMQAVLTNANADPQALLNQAAQQFQQVLDQSASS
jgi:multiple sugar transport system substrate-binding protein